MRKFVAKYRTYMIRSSWVSKLACGVILLSALYQILETIDIAGHEKVGDLPPAVLRSFILEALIVIAFALRFWAVSRIQYVPHWPVGASWFFCAVVGAVYFYTDYGGLGIYDTMLRIDFLANWMWAFIVFSAVRFFVTSALAYTVSLDEFDSYS